MHPERLAGRYPELFKPAIWGSVQAKFNVVEPIPEASLIAHVNIVPYCNDGWIIIQLADGRWEIPGGTLEPDEDYLSAARRELLEEAGASLHSFRIFGAWRCISSDYKPYRPHLPFPEFYRVVGIGEVEIIREPSNPDGDEMVTRVETVSIDEAAKRFISINRPDLAELYQLANEIVRTR